jgi:hypothetical protein
MLPNRIVRCLLISLTLILAVAPFATVSAEGQPLHFPLYFTSPTTVTGVCSFDVLVESTMDKGHMSVHTQDSTTRSILSGVLKLTITNLENEKSMEWVNPAQCTFVNNSDGSGSTSCHGPSSWWPQMPGLPPFALVKGSYSFSYDTSGNITDYKVTGTVFTVCEALK